MKIYSIFIFTLIFLSPAAFLNAEIVKPAHTEVEIISDSVSVSPGQNFRAAVRFKMDPGWHIYWINPGDSGLPPKIEWKLPELWTAGAVQWPYPEKIERKPLASYGYENKVFLMSTLKVPQSQPAGEVILKAQVDWLACQVDCIPGKAELSLSIKAAETPAADMRWVKLFSEIQSRVPLILMDKNIQAFLSEDKLLIRLSPESGEGFSEVYFFPENSGLIQHAAPQVLNKIAQGYELQIRLSENYPRDIQRLRGILFSSQGWRGRGSEKALSLDLPLGPVPEVKTPPVSMTLITALFFAFLGGIILNLMPCVLPVLSLKILSFIKEAAENPRAVFKHGLVFTGGVLLSFWFLAGLLIVFKTAGKYAGWGFQLQSPEFLVILTFIFFLFALNLFGIFEIGLSLTGLQQPGTAKRGLAGSFLSGVFAAVVATPCTAPFMGTALGFSLAQPAWVSFLIFSALGFGMAAPYLILCSQPAFLRFVPKPGAWMIRLKQFLALPLLATCGWLLWVLSLQRGTGVLKFVFAGLFFAASAAWIFGRWALSGSSRKSSFAVRAASLILLLSGMTLGIWGVKQGGFEKIELKKGLSKNKVAWESYSEKRLEELLTEKRAVFIDFTAAWCLTCQVNERVALDVPRVAEAFRLSRVIALKADWTSQDAAITRALLRYGRNSIPLYVFYREGSQDPVLLPELLTPGTVLEFLKKSEKK